MKRKRNMGELEELTYLKTVGDLRQHIGHVLHYSYTENKKDVEYMKRLTRVPTKKEMNQYRQYTRELIFLGSNKSSYGKK